MFNVYHYSLANENRSPFKRLETVNKRNSKKSVNGYEDHISFFFEKIDLEKTNAIYKKRNFKHPFWNEDNEFFLYTVDLEKAEFPNKIYYEIVESLEKTELLFDEKVSDEEYEEKLKDAIDRYHYCGYSVSELKKAYESMTDRLPSNWMNGLREKFVMSERFEANKNKYAPSVPHLMVYPTEGYFNYLNVEKISAIKPQINSKPLFNNW